MKLFKKKNRLEISDHITAINGRVIARKGDRINHDFLNQLLEQRPPDIDSADTIEKSDLISNFESLLDKPKYQFISNSDLKKAQLLRILASIHLNELIMKELTWMERSAYHHHHSLVVALLVARMTLDFYEDENKAREAASCALTHDFGITRVPVGILNKKSSLDAREMKVLREHPIYSYILLTYYGCSDPHLNAQVGYEHHEDLLGTGYPRGIILENLTTQFIQICDVFDALISARPFRPALTSEEALEKITEMVDNGQIDSEVFAVLKNCLE